MNKKELNIIKELITKLKFAKFKIEGPLNLKAIIDIMKQLDVNNLKTKYI